MTAGPAVTSGAFDLLDRRVQQWIWKQGWTDLRDIQEESIRAIVGSGGDLVIASATASGKTEAAFLPIGSALASTPPNGLAVLYVSPLKALINDQHPRLEEFFAELGLPVHRWHGDVPASRKRALRRNPSGVLLITPESLEALFVNRGSEVPRILGGVRYVVVDELHAFIETERGRQLQTLLHRIELAVRRPITRVGLSATIGDLDLACDFLRPGGGAQVRRIVSTGSRQALQLQVRGHRMTRTCASERSETTAENTDGSPSGQNLPTGDVLDIGRELFRTLRGGRHLVFPNTRADVELYSDLLRRLSERAGVKNEFWPHHGSLDKVLREAAEDALKMGEGPATIIATTTMELGLDVGRVGAIAQIGPPPSVASMRQRLGRSGRRGQPAVLRVYIQEAEVTPKTPPQDQLRSGLVQTVAMVRLLIERWYEPPTSGALHLSTLVQQILSLIAQHGSVRGSTAWSALCKGGPFRQVDRKMFAEVLKDLGKADLIVQTHDEELVLGLAGERLVNHHDFYAAFASPEEFRLVAGGKTLGTLPITSPVLVGAHLIFGGRRWKVLSVDDHRRLIQLAPSPGGNAPTFSGSGPLVHDRVREEMRRLYLGDDCPAYLNAAALDLLDEGRAAFGRFRLAERGILQWGQDTLLFPWVGDRSLNTLLIQLRQAGFEASGEGAAVLITDTGPDQIRSCLADLALAPEPDARDLAALVPNKQVEKHHVFLNENLLAADYASSRLDTSCAARSVQRLLSAESRTV